MRYPGAMPDTFEARALQMAYDLTTPNTYEGKVGQGYNEARAHDIRRLYNILCGRSPDEHGAGEHSHLVKLPPAPRKRKEKAAEVSVTSEL